MRSQSYAEAPAISRLSPPMKPRLDFRDKESATLVQAKGLNISCLSGNCGTSEPLRFEPLHRVSNQFRSVAMPAIKLVDCQQRDDAFAFGQINRDISSRLVMLNEHEDRSGFTLESFCDPYPVKLATCFARKIAIQIKAAVVMTLTRYSAEFFKVFCSGWANYFWRLEAEFWQAAF